MVLLQCERLFLVYNQAEEAKKSILFLNAHAFFLYECLEKFTMKTALLLIDIQNDYFPTGKMELVGSERASLNAKKILEKFRRDKNLIIHIQHVSTREGSTFFVPGSWGVEIHEHVKPTDSETVISKNYPNSFRETALLASLLAQDIEHLVILGMMTHMCVDATTRAAKDLGFSIEVIGDACATKSLAVNAVSVDAKDVQTAFLSALNYFYSAVLTTEEYLNA